jgi:hypothetical protein
LQLTRGASGLEVRERRPEAQRPPTPPAIAEVVARAAPPAVRAPIELACGRPDQHHQRAGVDQFDVLDDSPVETEQLLPYASSAHAATALSHRFLTLRSRNRKSTAACAPSCPEVGRSQRPDLIAPKRGRRRLSSSANPATSSANLSRAATATTALLDQTTAAALPRDRVHLTHGTCRGAHFLHQAELRHSKWSVLVSLAGITGDGDDLRAAHQVVSHFATRDIWLMLLVRKELEAIKSVEHLAAVIERKRTDEYLKLRVGTLARAVIDELAPRRHGVKVETGPEAFRRAVTRMQDQALNGVLDRAVADRARDPDGGTTKSALIDRARETLKALERNADERRSAPDRDPFMRDVYSLVIDVGAAFVISWTKILRMT